MFKIKISTALGGKPFIKQLPSSKFIWGDCEFFINENIEECDLWVVYGGLGKIEKVSCPKNNTLFITNEPESVKKYDHKFLNQFGSIITCQKTIKHKNKILTQQAIPWWVGKKYNDLKNNNYLNKTKLISVVTSNKIFTKEHKKRYEFVKRLEREFGDKIDIYGNGFNHIEDKWDAIAPYKYHIALENSSFEDYFTEKLADAFLGQAYPIYYGCPNIYEYFPKNTLTNIDINRPEEAIDTIRALINSNKFEDSKKDIEEAKDLILDKYQIFPMLAEYMNKSTNQEKILITLYPEKYRIKQKIKNTIKDILKKINLYAK